MSGDILSWDTADWRTVGSKNDTIIEVTTVAGMTTLLR